MMMVFQALQVTCSIEASSGEWSNLGEWRGWRADRQEQGLQIRARADDLGPELLRVQGQVPGPQGQGPRHVSSRLALQGEQA